MSTCVVPGLQKPAWSTFPSLAWNSLPHTHKLYLCVLSLPQPPGLVRFPKLLWIESRALLPWPSWTGPIAGRPARGCYLRGGLLLSSLTKCISPTRSQVRSQLITSHTGGRTGHWSGPGPFAESVCVLLMVICRSVHDGCTGTEAWRFCRGLWDSEVDAGLSHSSSRSETGFAR